MDYITRNPPRSMVLSCARWTTVFLGLPFVLWACVSHPLEQPTPEPRQVTDAYITVAPMRHLDLLFMVDNSLSMKPKQDKMKAQFPKLIDALRDRLDQTLPDLRIAIVDSDLGSAYSPGCASGYGDMGRFQMRDAANCGANADARWLVYTKDQPNNFTGKIEDVFGCLAGNVGVGGCGYEHQLAALEWAFYLDQNHSQLDFLRPEAYLGIVLLTDEDDCSAPQDTKMFANVVPAEAGSLRCATRGHICDGATLSYPTPSAVSVPFESCHARMDATCDSSVDTSGATTCNALMSVAQLADEVKQLKGGGAEADDKILVAAIYGTARKGDTTTRPYKIDLSPNQDPNSPVAEVYDYWPVCYDPDFMPAGSGFDRTAADHGATGGLRIKAFLDQFKPESRLAYSICESDFGPAMAGIGSALTNKMGNLCVPFKLADSEDEPGIQADCRVVYRIPRPVTDAKGITSLFYEENSESLPRCDAARKPECWEVKFGNASGTSDEQETAKRCPAEGSAPSQMINIVRKPGTTLLEGTKVGMQCVTCVDLSPGMSPVKGCDY
ncbi:MAG TPA: hypothetical protein VF550_17470 [Polyangia bacterium]